jgi:hypothetical protein
MKKLIVIAVYGNNPIYVNGAYENLLLQPKIYPDWTCRFYVDDTVPQDTVKLLEKDSEVVMMPRADGALGMWWRFEPFKDITIERFIVRDADSRLGVKEAAAVNEWIESGKEFHIMRDHQYHTQFIMGGMFGASSEFINKYKDIYERDRQTYFSSLSFQEIWHSSGKYFQTDQNFLRMYVWPRIINSHIAHIADRPGLRFTGNEKMFPIEDPDGLFVGCQDYMKNVPGYLQKR